jgi:LPS-assembly lipoprotein
LWSRRAALALPLGAAGCGFRPLYGPPGSGASGSSAAGGDTTLARELAAVRVGPSYERSGQLLRRNLQRRLEGLEPGTAAKYQLDLTVAWNYDPVGYRLDGTISRIRVTATGNWVLSTLSVPPKVLGRSSIGYRILDDFDVPDLQFFSADAARDAMEGRVMTNLADEVARQVAMTLRARLREQAAAATPAAATPAAK